MSTTEQRISAQRYREIRRRAVVAVAEDLILDPPDRSVEAAIPGYVGRWADDHYDDLLGRYDPGSIEAAVPTDPGDVQSSASTPLAEAADEERRRRELHAVHAVRADLTSALRERVPRLERAIAVHDALERLVGRRGGRTDRRPSDVVDGFAEWVARRRDEAAAERARRAFTPLHVMRIDGLDVVDTRGEPPELPLLCAIEEWLADVHHDATHGGAGSGAGPDGADDGTAGGDPAGTSPAEKGVDDGTTGTDPAGIPPREEDGDDPERGAE